MEDDELNWEFVQPPPEGSNLYEHMQATAFAEGRESLWKDFETALLLAQAQSPMDALAWLQELYDKEHEE